MPTVDIAGKGSAGPAESSSFGGVTVDVANGVPALDDEKLKRARRRFDDYYPALAHDDEEFAEFVKHWRRLGLFSLAIWVTDYGFAERPLRGGAR